MSKYPYKYEAVPGGVRIHSNPLIAAQMLSIAKKIYGSDLLNGVIFTGHWYVQIRLQTHEASKKAAHEITKIWRKSHNKALHVSKTARDALEVLSN